MKAALRHWWLQRLSAVLLAPLSLWFIYALVTLPSLEHHNIRDWIAAPINTALLLIFLPCLFYHAHLGLQVIVEDYLHSRRLKTAALALSGLALALAAVVSMAAVLLVQR